LVLQRRQPPLDGGSLDNGGAGDSVFRECFKNIVHLLDRMDNKASKGRIVTGDLVAFDEFRPFLNKPLDKVKLAGEWSDPHHRPDMISDSTSVDVNGETLNDAGSVQPPNPLRHTRR